MIARLAVKANYPVLKFCRIFSGSDRSAGYLAIFEDSRMANVGFKTVC